MLANSSGWILHTAVLFSRQDSYQMASLIGCATTFQWDLFYTAAGFCWYVFLVLGLTLHRIAHQKPIHSMIGDKEEHLANKHKLVIVSLVLVIVQYHLASLPRDFAKFMLRPPWFSSLLLCQSNFILNDASFGCVFVIQFKVKCPALAPISTASPTPDLLHCTRFSGFQFHRTAAALMCVISLEELDLEWRTFWRFLSSLFVASALHSWPGLVSGCHVINVASRPERGFTSLKASSKVAWVFAPLQICWLLYCCTSIFILISF